MEAAGPETPAERGPIPDLLSEQRRILSRLAGLPRAVALACTTSHEWIAARTGILERRVSAPGEAPSDMACEAARRCVANAGLPVSAVDLIVVACATPDQSQPAVACLVQEKLGAAEGRCPAFDVNSVCAGFVFSLDVAQSMMLAAPDQFRHVLVIGADAFSKILNWDDRRTCIFFGDGAGAVLTSQTADHARRIHFRLGSDGRGSRCIEVPAGGTRVPVTQEVLEKRLNTFFLDGPKVWTSRSRPCRARSAACCVNAGSRPRISIS